MTRKHAPGIHAQRPAFNAYIESGAPVEVSHNQLAYEGALLRTLARTINDDVGFDPDKLFRQDGFKYRILGAVMPEDFTRPEYRELFEAIRGLIHEGQSVDAARVSERLKQSGRTVGTAVVTEIFEGEPLADASQVDSYISRVTKRSRLRMVEVMARKVAEQARTARIHDEDFDMEAAVAKLQSVTFDLERKRPIVGEMPSEADAMPEFLTRLETSKTDRGFVGLDTGFENLNHVLNGLLTGLYVIAAPPGAGKTTFVKQLADNVAKLNRVPVVFFSRDTGANELRVMTLSRLAGVKTREVSKGRTDREVLDVGGPVKVWSKVEAAAAEYAAYGSLIHLVEADLETTVNRIRLMAQSVKKKHKAARILIVVDHLQALSVGVESRHLRSTKDRVDWIATELRRLAHDLDCPIVAVSSITRTSYEVTPTLSAFRDSGGIEFGTDVAGVLQTRPKQSVIGEYFRDVDLYILKNRFGETSRIAFTFAADRAKFEEQPTTPTSISYADTQKETSPDLFLRAE